MRLLKINITLFHVFESNIFKRELDHVALSNRIKDCWLLIDYADIRKNKYIGRWFGTIGWSSPEIDYTSKKK